ncbi:MAG TPA: GNAT family N-acetyltransferase [Actinomycetota bacterium]|nr:GNAT family N-acetyltransferase [Actinomycetota bacterium]
MKYSVRPAVEADIEESIDVLYAAAAEPDSYLGSMPPDREKILVQAHELLASPTGLVVVAEAEDGAIIGSLWAMGDGYQTELRLNVAREWRGRGVGSAMITSAIEWARAQGIVKVHLGVYGPNVDARRLYERLGFVVEGTRPRHYFHATRGEVWDIVWMGMFLDDEKH